MLTPGGMASRGASAADTALVKALARAFRWLRMMETGRFATINELAAAEKINSTYISRVLRLTLLAPDIVDALPDSRQPEGMTLPALVEPFLVEWEMQVQPLPPGWAGRRGQFLNLPAQRLLEAVQPALPARHQP